MRATASSFHRLSRVALATLVSGGMMIPLGCGIGVNAPASSPLTDAPAVISGSVHGGQQGVSHSVVSLYQAGSTGYGAGAAKLASTSTDKFGFFGFNKNSSGTNNGTDASWHCPTDGSDPLIYVIAQGGNPTGAADSAADNPALALISVLGPCSTVSATSGVDINEISTAATVTALGQYMSPGTTAGTEMIGSSGVASTTPPSTTPTIATGAIGITNAFNSLSNLINIGTGNTVASTTYTGANPSVAAVTVTATPESAKLLTMANILSACVNTTAPGASAGGCSLLFSGAVPPITGAGLSVGGTYPAAVDTLQAALYMAINPANLTASGSNTPTPGGACATASFTSNVSCLFSLVSGFPAFAGSLTSAPTDWTVGVTYSTSGACAGTSNGGFIQGPIKTAVDASGNVWFIGGATNATVGQNISEMSPTGQPLLCLGNYSAGRGVTIDPTGNVWASFNGSGTTFDIEELPVGTSTLVNWPTAASAVTSYGIASDGAGNIYYTGISNGGFLYRFAAPGTSTTPTAPSQYLGPFATSGTNNTTNIAFDPSQNVWVVGTTNSVIYNSYIAGDGGSTAAITAFSVTHSGTNTYSLASFTTPSQAPFTVGQQVTLSGFTSGQAGTANLNGTKVNVVSVTATAFTANIPTSSTFTSITSTPDSGVATVAAIDNTSTSLTATPYGLALDNSGAAYAGSTCCGTTGNYKTATKLFAGANGAAATVARSSQYLGGMNGVRSLALDGAGNMWMGNEFSSIGDQTATTNFPIVELAAPTVASTTTFYALSPTGTILANTSPGPCTTATGCPTGGGFVHNDVQEVKDIAVDPSGNVWAMNTGTEVAACSTYCGVTIVELVGAGVPVVTPISAGTATTKLATKP